MDIESFRAYCMGKKGVTESFPFDQHTLVFKVGSKMFALTSLQQWERGQPIVNLKCDPEWTTELRADYNGIVGAYHMNKMHWNMVQIDGSVPLVLLKKLIDHSYELVFQQLTKKVKENLE